MPIAPNTPEPLATALKEMEAKVQAVKSSLAYCAPEMMDQFWGKLQMELAETISDLYVEMGGKETGSFGQG